MLLVVALLALAAGLVMARGSPRPSGTAEAQLVRYLLEARALAMVDGRAVRIGIDTAAGRLVGPAPLGAFRPAGAARIAFDGPGADGILFYPDGSSPGGTVRAARADGTTDGAVVQPVTGAVLPLR